MALDGSQAQYFRAPLADATLFPAPTEAGLEELLILMTDIFPTGCVPVYRLPAVVALRH